MQKRRTFDNTPSICREHFLNNLKLSYTVGAIAARDAMKSKNSSILSGLCRLLNSLVIAFERTSFWRAFAASKPLRSRRRADEIS
jgi:hypothetical protein